MIVGTGVDIVELERIAALIKRQPQAIDRFLTEQEKALLEGKSETRTVEFIAGRFAAKEAGSKALGTGIGRLLGFLDMEIVPSKQGKPEMNINPQVLISLGFDPAQIKVHASISHSRSHAIAQVVIEEV